MSRVGSYFRRLQRAATLNLLVQLSSNLGIGFAAYYFKIHGVGLYKIVLIWAISPLVSLPVVALPKTWSVKKYLRLGALAFTGMALSLLFFNQYSFLLFGVFYGLALGCFWVSLNYLFFLKSSNDNYAKDSSVYFIVGPLVGIVLPPLGALIIGSLGYRVLFFITALLTLLPLMYIRGHYFDYRVKQTFREADRAFSGLRLIVFFDGALHFFQSNFLAIYALLFLKTEFQVGGLLSYLALLSLIASFVVSAASDKYKRRVEILYPMLIVMSILIIIVPAFKDVAALIPLIGVYSILDNLSLPIRFAVPMDVVKLDTGFWRANEFWGNTGRTVVFAAASLLLYIGNRWAAFLIFALMTFAFPFIIGSKIKAYRKPPGPSSA
jgi:MFS family permease